MELNNLISIKNVKSAKRVGRGNASGKGHTAGRGTKGQKSRSGYNIPRSFEGGQTPLIQRLPKARGFKSIHKKPAIIHIVDIEKNYSDGEMVCFKTLLEKGMIKDHNDGIKIVGPGKLTKKLSFRDVKLTKKLVEDLKLNVAEKKDKSVEKKEESDNLIKLKKPEGKPVKKIIKK